MTDDQMQALLHALDNRLLALWGGACVIMALSFIFLTAAVRAVADAIRSSKEKR